MWKLRRDCLFNFTCRFINFVNTFTHLLFLLIDVPLSGQGCWRGLSRSLAYVHHPPLLSKPLRNSNHCTSLKMPENFDWFIWKRFQLAFLIHVDPSCHLNAIQNNLKACRRYEVRNRERKLPFCMKTENAVKINISPLSPQKDVRSTW